VINLGFFRRSKKEDSESESVSEATLIKSPEQIEKERLESEHEFLKNEIKSKNE